LNKENDNQTSLLFRNIADIQSILLLLNNSNGKKNVHCKYLHSTNSIYEQPQTPTSVVPNVWRTPHRGELKRLTRSGSEF